MKNSVYNISPFIKAYFDVISKYEIEQEKKYPFILFYKTEFKQSMKKISPENFILPKIKEIEIGEENNKFTETEKKTLNKDNEKAMNGSVFLLILKQKMNLFQNFLKAAG